MSFNWEDYLCLASKLLKESEQSEISEAYLRTSASRAYYSVFCIAKNILREKAGINIGRFGAHKKLQQCFKKSKDASAQKIGQRLSDLHSFRLWADYDKYPKIVECDVTLQYKKAELLISALNELSANTISSLS